MASIMEPALGSRSPLAALLKIVALIIYRRESVLKKPPNHHNQPPPPLVSVFVCFVVKIIQIMASMDALALN
jgi:hypothetical protein